MRNRNELKRLGLSKEFDKFMIRARNIPKVPIIETVKKIKTLSKAEYFEKHENEFLRSLEGRRIGDWKFVGNLDTSGVWFWENMRSKRLLSATPYWGGDESIDVAFSDTDDKSIATIEKAISSPDEYIRHLAPVLRKI